MVTNWPAREGYDNHRLTCSCESQIEIVTDDMFEKDENGTCKYEKLDSEFYQKFETLHGQWAEDLLDFKIGLAPELGWVEECFEATNNEAPNNIDLALDSVENMIDWAKGNTEYETLFLPNIETRLNIGRAGHTPTHTVEELRQTVIDNETEIREKTVAMCRRYYEGIKNLLSVKIRLY